MPKHKIGTRSEVVESLTKIIDNHLYHAEIECEAIAIELRYILNEFDYIKRIVADREATDAQQAINDEIAEAEHYTEKGAGNL